MRTFFGRYKMQTIAAAAALVLVIGAVLSFRQCRRVEPTVSDGTPPTTLLTAAQTTDAIVTTGDTTGKTTDAAPATTFLTRKTTTVGGADPQKTTVRTAAPTTAQQSQKFSPTLEYTVPQAAQTYLDVRSLSLYHRLVDAYMQYETEVPFTADDQPQTALELLYWYCPVFFADTALDENCIDRVYNEVHIRYTSASRAEHEKIIKDFENRCLALLGDRRGDQATVAREVYRRFTKTLQYDTALWQTPAPAWDDPTFYTAKNPRYRETYTALMNGSGVCSSFAKAYAFLLLQCRVETMTVYCDHVSGDKDKSHAWPMFKLDGKWYFADPTWERNGSDTYFGVTTAEREQNGYLPQNFRLFFVYDTQFGEKFAVNDNRFMQ